MKFLKKLLSFIKNIFNTKEVPINNLDPEIIKQSETINNELIEEKEINEESQLKKLLDEIEIGDIIWAKRYKTEEEKKAIPKKHKEGPFVVVDKCQSGVVCCYGTSIYPENHQSKYFELDNGDYNLKKKTFFRLHNLYIIDDKSFVKKLDKLTENDMKKLLKQLKVNHGNYYKINKKNHQIYIPFEIGDLINYNVNYLIIDIIKDKFLCIRIDKSNTYLKNNLKFDDLKNLDYSKIVLIDIKEKISYISKISDNELLYVLKNQKEYINNCENRKTPQRGSVISKDNKYYYIYGEEGQDWLIFEISKTQNTDFDLILLNNNQFYTNYKGEKINKKDNYEVLLLATTSEIDLIKENKKSYIKRQKNITHEVGDIIIITNNLKLGRFIIINICKKTYECLSINKLKNAIYDPVLLNKSSVKLADNQDIKGIKWLEEHPEYNLKNVSNDIIELILKSQKEFVSKNTRSRNNNRTLNLKNGNTIVINGEEYIIKERIGNVFGCIGKSDKGVSQRKLKYFRLDEIIQSSIEISNQKILKK